MVKTLETVFDGKVFHPIEPLALVANTHIWVTIDTSTIAENIPYSFLKTARSLNLDGPPDWASRLDEYLYGGVPRPTEALQKGEKIAVVNLVNKENTATRYVHPDTGRSVVIDDITKEVIHVGGNEFKY